MSGITRADSSSYVDVAGLTIVKETVVEVFNDRAFIIGALKEVEKNAALPSQEVLADQIKEQVRELNRNDLGTDRYSILERIKLLETKLKLLIDTRQVCEDAHKLDMSEEDFMEIIEIATLRDPIAVCENIKKCRFNSSENYKKILGLLISLCPWEVWKNVNALLVEDKDSEKFEGLLTMLINICPEGALQFLDHLQELYSDSDDLAGFLSMAILGKPQLIDTYANKLNKLDSEVVEELMDNLARGNPELFFHAIKKLSITNWETVGRLLATILIAQPQLVLDRLEEFYSINPTIVFHTINFVSLLQPELVFKHIMIFNRYLDEEQKMRILEALILWDASSVKKIYKDLQLGSDYEKQIGNLIETVLLRAKL